MIQLCTYVKNVGMNWQRHAHWSAVAQRAFRKRHMLTEQQFNSRHAAIITCLSVCAQWQEKDLSRRTRGCWLNNTHSQVLEFDPFPKKFVPFQKCFQELIVISCAKIAFIYWRSVFIDSQNMFQRLFTHGIVGSRNAKLVSDWIILSQRPTKERDEDHTVRSLKVCRWSLLPIQFSQYVWLTCYVENLITHRNSISLSLGSYLSSFFHKHSY